MGIKPPVRQGNMLGGNVGLSSSQEYSRGYPLSSVALLLCRCRVMTGKMAQAESGNVSRKPDLGVIECITIVTASPKRWRSKWRNGSPSTQSRPATSAPRWSWRFRRTCSTQILPQIPLSRLGKPEEIAGLIIYLCSDEAVFVTGANIAVNGGQHMQ
jgi:hypothetical protein